MINKTALGIFIFILLIVFGYIIYTIYDDYKTYKNQEGLNIKKIGSKLTKTFKGVTNILNILKCPVSIFSNIQKCGVYYFQDKIFQFIWFIVWIINFVLIFVPVFIFDKLMCFFFNKCWNFTPNDVCVSKKSFFKFIENIYYLVSGGKRYLHRNSSDLRKCYCIPPLVFLFDPLRNFTSFFEQVSKASSTNYTALIIPIIILGVLVYKQKK
jgi:hypothetical protein